MRPDLPTGTVTFLFTDIEGSTRLLHALGPAAYADALAEHRGALREAFAAHGGVEVDTQGDAFFVAFPTPQGAAAAAAEGTSALADGPIRVRMGLHTGAPTLAGEGYVGVDVHRGARVAALAHGGQVVLSPATAALLDGAQVRDLGLHRLKDFEGAIRLLQLGLDEFPPLRTHGSVELPTPATRFLGRERELFQAVSLVYERDPRVLTILGPGGTGKTRFGLELARLLADEADGGSVFVALAPLRDPELVLSTIGDRLGAAAGNVDAIATRIGRKRTHVLCDNVEHLLPAAARPLAELAAAAPELRLLTTSREPLHIQGEVELDLPPLAEQEAVALFLERAQAVRPDLREDAAVAVLCARLDRLPLALELAAARTKLLSPEALLARLGESLDLLQGTRDADERHATLRATIGWSHDLLDPDEQRLFRRLAVFRGGATLESAEAVCDADLDTLASLLDKSLVRRRTGRLGEERFWMLETIREFAVERLETSGEADEVRRRHAERMLGIARSTHLSEDDDEPFDFDTALAEREDLRAALDWSAAHDPVLGLEIAVELERLPGSARACRGRCSGSRSFSAAAPKPRRAYAPEHCARSRDARTKGVHSRSSIPPTRRVSACSPSSTTSAGWPRSGCASDPAPTSRTTSSVARSYVEDCERVARGRYRVVESQASLFLGRFAARAGDLGASEAYLLRSRALASSVGWGWWEAMGLTLLLDLAFRRGELEAAEQHGRAALTIYAAEESRVWAVNALCGVAQVTLARGDLERAGVLWGAASAEGESVPGWDARVATWGSALASESRPKFLAAADRGRELDFWDGVAIALGEADDQTEP